MFIYFSTSSLIRCENKIRNDWVKHCLKAASNQYTSMMVSFYTNIVKTHRTQKPNTENLLLGPDYTILILQIMYVSTFRFKFKKPTLKKYEITFTYVLFLKLPSNHNPTLQLSYQVEFLIPNKNEHMVSSWNKDLHFSYIKYYLLTFKKDLRILRIQEISLSSLKRNQKFQENKKLHFKGSYIYNAFKKKKR